MEMYQKSLVVSVREDGIVLLSVRTSDERVDEFKMTKDTFEDLVQDTKVVGRTTRFKVRIDHDHSVFFAVPTAAFQVMISEYRAQVGG